MQVKTLLTGFSATAALCLAGVASGQTTFTWTGAEDNGNLWNTPNNWDLNSGYPDDANDIAVFEGVGTGGSAITVQMNVSPTIGEIHVISDGSDSDVTLVSDDFNTPTRRTLTLEDGADTDGNAVIESDNALRIGRGMTVVSASAGVTHEIGGVLELSYGDGASTSEESIFLVEADGDGVVTFGPDSSSVYGIVDGLDEDVRIQIDPGADADPLDDVKLRNEISVVGMMLIQPTPGATGDGTATFENARETTTAPQDSGVVRADRAGALILAAGLDIFDALFDDDDDYRPLWEADGSNAVLEFHEDAGDDQQAQLYGNVEVANDGVVHLFATISTRGDLFGDVGDVTRECNECLYYNWVSPFDHDSLCTSCGP